MNVTYESVSTQLASEDYGNRLSAVNQMRYLDAPQSFELLQKAIADENPRVRYAAISQLASVGNHDREASLALLENALLRDSDMDVRAAAADSVGALKLTEAFEAMETLYQQTDEWLVRFSIIAALGELGDPRGYDLLIKALEGDHELIRTVAIGALGELKDLRAVPYLAAYVDNPDWQIRHRVAQALGQIGGGETRSALATLAEDDVEQVAQEAKRAL
ncbi:MAG: HEAT repeat domain-containing protein [Cyanobacteria bacterium P01_A01_bin.135]